MRLYGNMYLCTLQTCKLIIVLTVMLLLSVLQYPLIVLKLPRGYPYWLKYS